MGLRSTIGNLEAGASAWANNTAEQLRSKAEAIFNTAAAKIGSIYTGGFIGIDGNNWGAIKSAVDKMIEAANEEITKFNELADRDQALKGEAATAVGEYLKACKELLEAYVSTLNNFIADANTAGKAFIEGDTQNAQAVQEATQNIQSEANEIKVDEVQTDI